MTMYIKTARLLIASAFISAGALSTSLLNAQAVRPAFHAAATQQTPQEAAEVTALRPAFTTLLGADHDYDGHRAKAMHAIAAACRLLGTDIRPAGERSRPTTRHATPEPEQQSTSDTQLRQAQTTVQQVLQSIPSGKQPRVTALLQEAVTEIGLALSVK